MVFLLKLTDDVCENSVCLRSRLFELNIIILPGNIGYPTQQTYVSDSSFEGFTDGFIPGFFLKPSAGIPLSSNRASR